MDNQFDPYLSRSLKNWVNNHPPSTRAKELLLRAATELPRIDKGNNTTCAHPKSLSLSSPPYTYVWSLNPAFLCAARSLWPWPSRLA